MQLTKSYVAEMPCSQLLLIEAVALFAQGQVV